MITISYAITACSEAKELERLLNYLHELIDDEDEIMVQLDNNHTKEVENVVRDFVKKQLISDKQYDFHRIYFSLNNDFASFKNNLKQHCTKKYIFQIDADEIPNKFIISNLRTVLENHPDIDVYSVPRINTVEGLTEEWIKKWGWTVNKDNWVNFPDFQMRILRNTPEIRWENKVHEILWGFKTITYFPSQEEWCLNHPKTIERQISQNQLYASI